ncbi:MAG: hypothetical protein CL678_00085, partial [Bdellovibrionaceae bacterium]|nr:hypothetical protein [Pseudobdellovibrionaceae bacterium]
AHLAPVAQPYGRLGRLVCRAAAGPAPQRVAIEAHLDRVGNREVAVLLQKGAARCHREGAALLDRMPVKLSAGRRVQRQRVE